MKTILLIEDEPTLQKAFGDVLDKAGYKITGALDGEQGLKMAKETNPDMILLDLILPKMDGFEVLEKIMADPETKDIPVIILTNLERTEDVNRAIELGAKTYLVKANYSIQEILEKIKQILK